MRTRLGVGVSWNKRYTNLSRYNTVMTAIFVVIVVLVENMPKSCSGFFLIFDFWVINKVIFTILILKYFTVFFVSSTNNGNHSRKAYLEPVVLKIENNFWKFIYCKKVLNIFDQRYVWVCKSQNCFEDSWKLS